ncbi:uncharacterized protein EV422DRAFT_566233 [Fimicolochytrium jonesii]|uniref:uncharacterized protein n=1 Tax=Fimicolochytrium jonesii TaxID=1396493 RepID=UPI0022FF4199|nr:uncharacterized protein EV422DRAFT_566233 [Fimicolochytrium jonesii]KAI8822553.1 hypothetical protein EV422DRAFT_566233 [Fimicolochytrium jonesii]
MANPPTPAAPPRPQSHPLDFAGMPVTEAYKHINRIERRMTPEQLMQAKMQIMRPYKTRNMAVGGGLIAFVLGIYVYSMYKTGHDDFDIPVPRAASGAAATNAKTA